MAPTLKRKHISREDNSNVDVYHISQPPSKQRKPDRATVPKLPWAFGCPAFETSDDVVYTIKGHTYRNRLRKQSHPLYVVADKPSPTTLDGVTGGGLEVYQGASSYTKNRPDEEEGREDDEHPRYLLIGLTGLGPIPSIAGVSLDLSTTRTLRGEHTGPLLVGIPVTNNLDASVLFYAMICNGASRHCTPYLISQDSVCYFACYRGLTNSLPNATVVENRRITWNTKVKQKAYIPAKPAETGAVKPTEELKFAHKKTTQPNVSAPTIDLPPSASERTPNTSTIQTNVSEQTRDPPIPATKSPTPRNPVNPTVPNTETLHSTFTTITALEAGKDFLFSLESRWPDLKSEHIRLHEILVLAQSLRGAAHQLPSRGLLAFVLVAVHKLRSSMTRQQVLEVLYPIKIDASEAQVLDRIVVEALRLAEQAVGE